MAAKPMAWMRRLALVAAIGGAFGAAAQPAGPIASDVENSPLDAQLVYQLLIGEIELNRGDAGTGF
ncbi:MAG: hypothetical protein ABW220_15925, partial [Burkholderiaceae bacterium]